MNILITGWNGLLGRYLMQEFASDKPLTLSRNEESDIRCDLSSEVPVIPEGKAPELVIHAAGSQSETDALAVNLEGTKNLLEGLEKAVPEKFVYISAANVYASDSGENIDEEANTWATDKVGQSKALAEQGVKDWCRKHNVILTILRPATMYGTGMKGAAHEMFLDVVNGRYIHIRGNDAKTSAVMALDVARAARRLAGEGGIYNLSDGNAYTYIDLADAMSANAGAMKRMTHLPRKWADTIYRFGRFIPLVSRSLNPQLLEARSRTLTLSNRKASEAGVKFHSVGAVLRREDPDYPYETD